MRKIPIEYIREGQVLSKTVCDFMGNTILQQNTKLKPEYIDKLKKMGISSVGIRDSYSLHELNEIIKPTFISKFKNTENKVIELMKNKEIAKDKMGYRKTVHGCVDIYSDLIDDILDDVFNSNDILNNLLGISAYDDCTCQHSINVMILSLALSKGLNLDKDDVKKVALGCLLHDIGKTYIPIDIINKNGKLTVEEFNIIKNHPLKGYEFLRDCTNVSLAEQIIALTHHEKWDGTGYPNQKKAGNTHPYGQICTICDVFDALTADRPYRKGIKPHEAIEYLMGNGNILFSHELIESFIKVVNIYPKGTMVLLSNGTEGIVERVSEYNLRPVVKIFCEQGRKTNPYFIDLIETLDIVIQDIIYKFSFNK